MWHTQVCHGQDDFEYDTNYKNSYIFSNCKRFPCEDTTYSFDIEQPYFTLNRALELLPKKIKVGESDFRYLTIDWNGAEYKCNDLEIEYSVSAGTRILKAFGEDIRQGDIELAALRLLVKVIKGGYLGNDE